MVSGMSQRKALNDTALGTANWLVNWGKTLKAEMEKQGIPRHATRTPIVGANPWQQITGGGYTTDDKETITFTRGQIRQLLNEMAQRVEKLRRFEKPIGGGHKADD
ncbi:hypothetical protein [Bradyrhizobium sp. AUGA SZCCT0182]|uniref:hypothetical protein n=1 Tax=Bradyrhizobium sp. AUGA SZCCT0182 TaxID=2807667 RepID=UPI001BAB0B3C|nr:hypothetical protein [Bradyrhizobium sp. AUGA SZCCT0182]MBR1235622.1 hypothetical protein [Bradyrhizobium sp. AUGA SZCCT0182]